MTPDRPPSRDFWPDWLTPRRFFQFAANLVQIESDVASLKADVARLRGQMADLREQNAAQAARIEVLTGLLTAVVSNRTSRAADGALTVRTASSGPGEQEETT